MRVKGGAVPQIRMVPTTRNRRHLNKFWPSRPAGTRPPAPPYPFTVMSTDSIVWPDVWNGRGIGWAVTFPSEVQLRNPHHSASISPSTLWFLDLDSSHRLPRRVQLIFWAPALRRFCLAERGHDGSRGLAHGEGAQKPGVAERRLKGSIGSSVQASLRDVHPFPPLFRGL